MLVDLVINIASELLTLLKVIEFLSGLAVMLIYEKNLFFKNIITYLETNNIVIHLGLS